MKVLPAITKGQVKIKRFIIPYRVYGNDGLHLVCLNGVQQSMAMWHSFVSRFSQDHKIILFDFPGQGKSSVESGSLSASIDEQVEILSGVIKATGASNIVLCSASWGGVVAMVFATKYPQLVKRLILAGMGTRPNKKMVETIKKGCNMDDRERKAMAQVLIKSFGENLPGQIKERISKQFSAMSKESLRAFCEHGLFILSAKSLGDIVDFKNIKVETILLNGEKDTIIDLEDVKFLAAQIPNCKMKIIKNVGHFLHLEDDNVLDIYSDILSTINN
jgi:pimeloyl-ACP methyl ester carboxylesterase